MYMILPKSIKKLFWDTDTRGLKKKKSSGFVISRVADKGGLADVKWLKKKFGKKAIKHAVAHSRNVSLKTKNFWNIV